MRRSLFALTFALVLAISGASSTVDTLKVEGGLISGTTDDGVRSFKGIPFAAPPIGELRWKAPRPVVPWDGVRRCDAFGPECPQSLYPTGSMYYSPPQKQSEDCLFLNVWTGAKANDK